jgi:hypothetical protein
MSLTLNMYFTSLKYTTPTFVNSTGKAGEGRQYYLMPKRFSSTKYGELKQSICVAQN